MNKITSMRTLFKIAFLVTISASLTSCFDKSKPNYQYFPNMYESASYETYGAYSIFPDEQSAMMPAENTVPRGWQPYEYEDSNEGLLKAKAELTNPYEVNESNLAVGR